MRRLILLVMMVSLLAASALAEAPAALDKELMVRPGKLATVSFEAAADGQAALSVFSSDGTNLLTLAESFPVVKGKNSFVWNGFGADNQPLKPGNYSLIAKVGDQETVLPFAVGEESPSILAYTMENSTLTVGRAWEITVYANQRGTITASLNQNGTETEAVRMSAVPGANLLTWDGMLNGEPAVNGDAMLRLVLMDDTGFESNAHLLNITIEGGKEAEAKAPIVPAVTATEAPAAGSAEQADSQAEDAFDVPVDNMEEGAEDETEPPDDGEAETADDKTDEQPDDGAASGTQPEKTKAPVAAVQQYRAPASVITASEQPGSNYWTLNMGEWDEQKIWNAMMQPITVIRGEVKEAQKNTYKLRAAPSESRKKDNIVGEITFESQGVHVLETLDNGWSKVEAYNSSYGPRNKNRPGYGLSDDLIQGYVETKYLKQIQPKEDYGVLIDKLTQRMYVFEKGRLLSTLLISTGKPTTEKPWNETPAGEFLIVSKTGDFMAGNLVCAMGMRINGGCLIHEVPYILNEKYNLKDYSYEEWKLGSKASHGCIRVQRKKNEDGLNMAWLNSRLSLNTRVMIWDDMPGRYYAYPDDSMQLYCNPRGGKYYHSNANCPSIKSRYLPLKGEFTYGDLEKPEYQKLTPCRHCDPPVRKAEIDKLNEKNGFK